MAARDLCVIYLGRGDLNRKTSNREGDKND